MNTSKCPACNSDIVIEEEAYEGDLVDCSNCEKQSEIISLRPPQLSLLEDNED